MSDNCKRGAIKCQDANAKTSRKQKQSPWPDSYDPTQLTVSKDFTFQLRRRGQSKYWEAVRFLFAKAVYEPSELTVTDVFIVDSCLEALLDCSDRDWCLKYRRRLLQISNCHLLLVNAQKGKPTHEALKLLLNTFSWGFLMSAHAYFGGKKHFRPSDWIVRRNRRLNVTPKPPRRIGVGYRDHGTCSVPEIDASPSWQEVASTKQVNSRESQLGRASRDCLFTYSLFQRKRVPVYHP